MHRGLKKPLLDAVAPGKVVVGYEIHNSLKLKQGDKLLVQGKPFVVTKLHPQRGSNDDVTVWIDLQQAQELFGMENVIHAILALECECSGDRITQIRSEIQAILPGTQVIERYSTALARAESRAKSKQVAETALAEEVDFGKQRLERERVARGELEQQHERLATVLVPTVMFACASWLGCIYGPYSI